MDKSEQKLSSIERLNLRAHLPSSIYFKSLLHYIQKHGSPFIHLNSQLPTTTMRLIQEREEKDKRFKTLL